MSVSTLPHAEVGQGELKASIGEQLRNAELFLARDGVKVSPFAEAVIYYFAASAEEVDEIAAAIGGTAEWDENRTHYIVSHSFGSEVKYLAAYIRKDRETPVTPVPAQTEGRAA